MASCASYEKQQSCYSAKLQVVARDSIFLSVQSRGLVALPVELRRRLGLDRPGAQVEVFERGGEIVLRPHVPIPAGQAWFWSAERQSRELEASADVEMGRIRSVDGVAMLLEELAK